MASTWELGLRSLVSVEVLGSYSRKKKKLLPLRKTYLSTDTLSCYTDVKWMFSRIVLLCPLKGGPGLVETTSEILSL